MHKPAQQAAMVVVKAIVLALLGFGAVLALYNVGTSLIGGATIGAVVAWLALISLPLWRPLKRWTAIAAWAAGIILPVGILLAMDVGPHLHLRFVPL